MLQSGAFVGRERELEELLGALDEARSGQGRVITLGGEPGIGKSRLADELAVRARERDCEVLSGRGWEDAGAPAYWSWVQALRSHIRATDPDDLRRQLGAGAGDVAQMLPELRRAPSRCPSAGRRRVGISAIPIVRFDHVIPSKYGSGPPDPSHPGHLQAADTPSILLLRFVASQLSDMRVLLIGTYRDLELTPVHPLTAAIDDDRPGAACPGDDPARPRSWSVGRYIESAANVSLSERTVAAVWRGTGGNPLFVAETVRLFAAEGHLSDAADLPSLRLAIPASVRAVIARRVQHLDTSTADALRLASALGPEFSIELLRRIGDFEIDHASELVADAVHAGLLASVAGAAGRYRFAHDLIRETLYAESPPAQRARLHMQIAEAVETLHANTLDLHLAELAFHYSEAAADAGPEEPGASGRSTAELAVDYALRAGDRAAGSLAYEEADRLYRMALPGWT